jgi:hypothetical protein
MVTNPSVKRLRLKDRRGRLMSTVFWVIAILATAFAWAGLSLKDLLSALVFAF